MEPPDPLPPPVQATPLPPIAILREDRNGRGMRQFIRAIMAAVTILWMLLLLAGLFVSPVLVVGVTVPYAAVMVILFVAYFVSCDD